MDLIIQFNYLIIILVIAMTAVFAYYLKDLRINTNVFGFLSDVPPAPIVGTPAEAPKEKLKFKNLNTEIQEIKKGEVIEVPIRENSFLAEEFSNSKPYEYVEPILNPFEGTKDSWGYNDGYVIIFSSERMFDPDVLNTIEDVRRNLENRYEIGSCFSPFDYVTVEKKGMRLSITPISPVSDGEKWTEETAEVFKNRLLGDSIARNYLYSNNGTTIMIYYSAKGLNARSIAELDTIVNPLREYGRVALNGGGLITNAVTNYINRDLILLVSLCFLVILIVFFLSFHSIKASIIPAAVSLLGLIWTLGTMAMMGYDLTIVTILTPCLVLTLGSSYSIHMVNEYYKAYLDEQHPDLPSHYAKISKTIFFAMLTTVGGFLSLLICRVSLFKELGITISIGIFYCWILSLTLIPALLSLTKKPTEKHIDTLSNGRFARIISKTGQFVVTRYYIFLIILIAALISFIFLKNQIGFDSNYMSYFPNSSEIAIDSKYFAKTLGGTDPYYITIKAPEGSKNFFLDKDNLKDVYAYEAAIQYACPDIVQVLSFSQYVSFLNEVYNSEKGIPDNNGLILLLSRTLKQMKAMIDSNVIDSLISDDGNTIRLSMRNYDSVEQDLQTTASLRRLNDTLNYYLYMLPEGTTSQISSMASENLRGSNIIIEDQSKSLYLSLFITFVIASISCASVFYGFTTLIPVFFGVISNYVFMKIIGMNFDIVTIGFSSIAIGCGVDDAIHFLLRLKDNKKRFKNKSYKDIVYKTITETGRPIILTTLSIDAGLFVLLFASFKPVRYFGLLMCVALTSAMLATITILPAVFIFLDYIKTKLIRKKEIKK